MEMFDHVNLAVNTSLCYQKTLRSAFHYHRSNMIQNCVYCVGGGCNCDSCLEAFVAKFDIRSPR